jgi:hypothetical protein
MSGERKAWLDMVRDVGTAFGDLARAELTSIADDLGRSGSALVRALVVAAVAAAFAFWTLGLAVYFTVELLTRVVPRWAAVGLVLALFLMATVVLLLVVRSRLAAIEPPAATVRRRLEDSRRWWHARIAPPEGGEPESGEREEER